MGIVSAHAAGKGTEADAVFSILQRANQAIERWGRENVVNASIGAIYDEAEQFAYFTTVKEYLANLAAAEMMSYAPIAGLPEFHQAAISQTFRGFQPENTYVRAIATPGGTGAVRHALYNYSARGEDILIPDWAWGPYRTIAAEHGRGVAVYALFNEAGQFNLASLEEKTRDLLKRQDHVVIIFNTPAHNPSGYSLTVAEWEKIVAFFRECAVDQSKRIVPLLDIAYLDYAGTVAESRSFFQLFTNLPANILVTFAFSMSKSYLVYGLRSGALIGLSSSEEVVEEFYRVNACSNRGVWSNGTRCAQRLLADVVQNPDLAAKIDQEREAYSRLLAQRAALFLAEAAEVGLNLLPYQSGFFITIPTNEARAVVEKLIAAQLYTVPLQKGVRIAICGVPTNKIPGMATKIKKALPT